MCLLKIIGLYNYIKALERTVTQGANGRPVLISDFDWRFLILVQESSMYPLKMHILSRMT